ncbi:flavin reductase family protein [Streptomyces beihaiensis]|uniref:Flavin reductase family protein n=1 Tax=Streptomyces beihaiensis TaxID=2984495 RepID=A0ABT3U1H8_9ACTN|nr:flavin reductase family protein [Streptomyces beihaiensis]MCX3062910.1 flavin reductase family protein [Streptomyces beihaiensis]
MKDTADTADTAGAALTRAMSRVPGPVTVATTIDTTGRRWGFTATSFSSLSLNPPLVLVCLNQTASTHGAFASASRFLVNVLAHDQEQVARRFARSGVDRFAEGDMEPCEQGLPGLPGACARVACALHAVLDGGDHSILVGRVLDSHVDDYRTPLLYHDRTFTHPASALDLPDPLLSLHMADW